MNIRLSRRDELDALSGLFTSSVHGLTAEHYDAQQRRAWAPDPPDPDHWHSKLDGQRVLVAEQDGELLGFLGYEPDGHVDVLFTAPAHARRGVARRLHTQAEHELRAAGCQEMSTEASEVAKPFFERVGYAVIEREVVVARGVELPRYVMRKSLAAVLGSA